MRVLRRHDSSVWRRFELSADRRAMGLSQSGIPGLSVSRLLEQAVRDLAGP